MHLDLLTRLADSLTFIPDGPFQRQTIALGGAVFCAVGILLATVLEWWPGVVAMWQRVTARRRPSNVIHFPPVSTERAVRVQAAVRRRS